jgi:hypothetical protein
MAKDNLHDIPETVEVQGEKSESGKLSVFLSILKRSVISIACVALLILNRFIGVKDISAVRLSLPAQLVEPVGNIEYTLINYSKLKLGIGVI